MNSNNIHVTARQRQILQLTAEGRSSDEVAAFLGVTVRTVESHRSNVRRQFRLRRNPDLTRYAIDRGLLYVYPSA